MNRDVRYVAGAGDGMDAGGSATQGAVAGRAGATVYSDEYIEYWAKVFAEHGLFKQRGICFETFLLAPREILTAVKLIPRSEPLLSAQAAVMHRDVQGCTNAAGAWMPWSGDLEESMVPDGAMLRGGVYVLPLKHHTYAISDQHHNNRRVPA